MSEETSQSLLVLLDTLIARIDALEEAQEPDDSWGLLWHEDIFLKEDEISFVVELRYSAEDRIAKIVSTERKLKMELFMPGRHVVTVMHVAIFTDYREAIHWGEPLCKAAVKTWLEGKKEKVEA